MVCTLGLSLCALLPFMSSVNAQINNLRGLRPAEYEVAANPPAWEGATYPNCQWLVKYSYNATPQGLIDDHALYYAQIVRGAASGMSYKIKGRFPPVDYFSWQVYNSLSSSEPASSFTDYKVTPHWGKNPFNDASATPEDTGGYELYITPSGSEGYANEMKLPSGISNTLILRMYQTDPILPKDFPIHWIEPPVLYTGHHTNDGRIAWTPLPECNDRQERAFPDLATTFYEINYPQNTGTLGRDIILRNYNCPLNPDQGNVSMVLFEGDWLKPEVRNLVARQSSDSPYLFYCINPHNNWRHYLNTIFKIRFKLPSFPDGLYEDIKVANKDEYDMRYFSISTADAVLVQPTIEALAGRDIRAFYNASGTWDGFVEVTIAHNEQKAKECGMYDPNNIFMPLESPRVDPAKAITIVIRNTLANGPKTGGAASRACNQSVNCGNPYFIRNIMQEYYPEMQMYHCESGHGQPPVVTKYQDYWGYNA